MVISIAFLLLLLAVVVLQSGQGLFSALITTVLALCCAAAAFGTHEWVAHRIAEYWKPDFAHPIALGAVFGIPLLVLRLVIDRLIRRDCVVSAMVGRVGGGICGIVTGLTVTGIAALCVQMLPFGTSILGFSRFSTTTRDVRGATPPSPDEGEHGLWLSPDRFAAATGALLVDGVFSDGDSFSETYPDFVQAVGWVSTVPASMSRYAKPRSIAVIQTQEVPFVYRLVRGDEARGVPPTFEPIPPDVDKMFQMVRVQLKAGARDPNKSHFFTLRQFRLVGTIGPDGPARQFHAVAIQQAEPDPTINRHIRFVKDARGDWPVVDEPYAPRADNADQVEVVFDLPKSFTPRFLEYKRGARAAVRFSEEASSPQAGGPPPSPPPAAATPSAGATTGAPSKTGADRPRRRRRGEPETAQGGGRVRRFATLQGQSAFGSDLPMELTAYRGVRNLETSGDALKSGHLIADVPAQESGGQPPLKRFDVPSDKRLLHLNVSALQARSTFGKALSFAVGVAQNYLVEDARGRQYKIVGKYAIAKVNGVETLEIQYFPEQAGTIGGLGAFSKIKEDQIKRDEHLVFLFLVDPGAEIVSFSTGGSASRREDLRAQQLVAPQ